MRAIWECYGMHYVYLEVEWPVCGSEGLKKKKGGCFGGLVAHWPLREFKNEKGVWFGHWLDHLAACQ